MKNLMKYRALDEANAMAEKLVRTAVADDKVAKPKKIKKKFVNGRHSKANPNWITPDDIVQCERLVYQELGLEIDLDPFSCEKANSVVRAKRYFTEKDDGFAQPWLAEAAHVNHPGGTTKRSWRKLMDEVQLGNTKRAVWVGFSVEQLCLLSDPLEGPRADPLRYPAPQDFTCVMLRSRIDFIDDLTMQPGGRPGHSNYLTFVNIPTEVVEKYFGPLGRVFRGSKSI